MPPFGPAFPRAGQPSLLPLGQRRKEGPAQPSVTRGRDPRPIVPPLPDKWAVPPCSTRVPGPALLLLLLLERRWRACAPLAGPSARTSLSRRNAGAASTRLLLLATPTSLTGPLCRGCCLPSRQCALGSLARPAILSPARGRTEEARTQAAMPEPSSFSAACPYALSRQANHARQSADLCFHLLFLSVVPSLGSIRSSPECHCLLSL